MLPNASPNEAKTLDEAGPNVIVTSCNSEPSPRSPAFSKQAGHRPDGASAVASLRNLGSNPIDPSPSLPEADHDPTTLS